MSPTRTHALPVALWPPHAATAEGVFLTGASHGPRCHEELMIAVLLTAQWMLLTGRRLGEYPVLHHHSADRLIEFWADAEMEPDHTEP